MNNVGNLPAVVDVICETRRLAAGNETMGSGNRYLQSCRKETGFFYFEVG
ncbi:hypothetical protein [Nitrosospira briensis]|nr:hypothetical protein [Nitrosospira briensis]